MKSIERMVFSADCLPQASSRDVARSAGSIHLRVQGVTTYVVLLIESHRSMVLPEAKGANGFVASSGSVLLLPLLLFAMSCNPRVESSRVEEDGDEENVIVLRCRPVAKE